jgi:hypothetical protein
MLRIIIIPSPGRTIAIPPNTLNVRFTNTTAAAAAIVIAVLSVADGFAFTDAFNTFCQRAQAIVFVGARFTGFYRFAIVEYWASLLAGVIKGVFWDAGG